MAEVADDYAEALRALCVQPIIRYAILPEVQEHCMVEGATIASKEFLYKFASLGDSQQGHEQPDYMVADILCSRERMNKQRCRGEDSQREDQRGYKTPLQPNSQCEASHHCANNVMDHARS